MDGEFGPVTERAVVSFQNSVKITADGLVGPKTRQALAVSYIKKEPPEHHTVRPGETLSYISSRYGVSLELIQTQNKITNPNRIYVGQVLTIKPMSVSPPEIQNEPVAPEPSIPAFPQPDKGICLTFDDGPDLLTTGPILSTLDKYGVKGVFFVIGEKAEKHPELVREMVEKGHAVGVHGFEHKPLTGLPTSEVLGDIKKARDAIVAQTGYEPYLYRPPGGGLDSNQILQAARLGLNVMMWTNVGGADLGANTPDEVVERVINQATNGGIILLHEGIANTVEALPDLIESLARLGYGFRTPAEPS